MLNLIKVFEGSFGGATLYENPNYITPNAVSNLIVKQKQCVIGVAMALCHQRKSPGSLSALQLTVSVQSNLT